MSHTVGGATMIKALTLTFKDRCTAVCHMHLSLFNSIILLIKKLRVERLLTEALRTNWS